MTSRMQSSRHGSLGRSPAAGWAWADVRGEAVRLPSRVSLVCWAKCFPHRSFRASETAIILVAETVYHWLGSAVSLQLRPPNFPWSRNEIHRILRHLSAHRLRRGQQAMQVG